MNSRLSGHTIERKTTQTVHQELGNNEEMKEEEVEVEEEQLEENEELEEEEEELEEEEVEEERSIMGDAISLEN